MAFIKPKIIGIPDVPEYHKTVENCIADTKKKCLELFDKHGMTLGINGLIYTLIGCVAHTCENQEQLDININTLIEAFKTNSANYYNQEDIFPKLEEIEEKAKHLDGDKPELFALTSQFAKLIFPTAKAHNAELVLNALCMLSLSFIEMMTPDMKSQQAIVRDFCNAITENSKQPRMENTGT